MGTISFTVNPDSRISELSSAINVKQQHDVKSFLGQTTPEGGIRLFSATTLGQALLTEEGLESYQKDLEAHKKSPELVHQAFTTLLINEVLHNGGTFEQATTFKDKVLQDLSFVSESVIQKTASPSDVTAIENQLRAAVGKEILYTPAVERAIEAEFDDEFRDLRDLAKTFTHHVLEQRGNIDDVKKTINHHLAASSQSSFSGKWEEFKEQAVASGKTVDQALADFKERRDALLQDFGLTKRDEIQRQFAHELLTFIGQKENQHYYHDITQLEGGVYESYPEALSAVADSVVSALAVAFDVAQDSSHL